MDTLPKNVIQYCICILLSHQDIFNLSLIKKKYHYLRNYLKQLGSNNIQVMGTSVLFVFNNRSPNFPITKKTLTSILKNCITPKNQYVPPLLQHIISKYPSIINRMILEKIFTHAARKNDIVVLFYLIQQHDIKLYNIALAMGAKNNSPNLVDAMYHLGATEFEWALALASRHGNNTMVDHLLYNADYASDIKYSPAGFNQAMAMAAYGGYIEIVMQMIFHGATDFDWGLSSAAMGDHIDIVDFMIDRGATNHIWALKSACYAGNLDIVKKIIELNNKIKNDSQVLEWARMSRNIDIINYLRS